MIFKNDTSFIGDNFLLDSKTAEKLYYDFASKMPIIDYHNHLSPEIIATNKPFENLNEIWLKEDHYKWRAMRANGIYEKYITGNTTPYEKFEKWAETVPYTVANPLFHWTHLELQRYFNIKDLLQPSSAKRIYETANKSLKQTTPRQFLEQMNVEVICTTDDILDSLEHHILLKKNYTSIKILPTFRADSIFEIEDHGYNSYIKSLEELCNSTIQNLSDLLECLQQRVNHFHENGCRLSDYGLPQIYSEDFTDSEIDSILTKQFSGKALSLFEINNYKSCIQYYLSKMYFAKGWVQQFHLGAIRNNNKRLLTSFGKDSGTDSISDFSQAKSMSTFFNRLDNEGTLCKTITYNLNPSLNEVFATMMGNFNDGSFPAKMQWGAAWWFSDQKDGIEKQLNVLSNIGLLSRFVGMVTDSRSLLSFPRHEYFRRILCTVIGNEIDNGTLPNDINFFGKMIENICYHNAVDFFKFDK
ncbi:MAG: glucuronate isomerase [Cellulophaga sp.]